MTDTFKLLNNPATTYISLLNTGQVPPPEGMYTLQQKFEPITDAKKVYNSYSNSIANGTKVQSNYMNARKMT